MTTDPRALQLAESRYRNGFGPTVAEPWEQIHPDLRQDHVTEADAWLRSAIAAGLIPAADSPTAMAGAATSESWGIYEYGTDGSVIDIAPEVRRLRDEAERHTEDLADADNPTRLRWGLNDVMWGDDDSVTVLLSGPDREPYWLELDVERATALREDLAGPHD